MRVVNLRWMLQLACAMLALGALLPKASAMYIYAVFLYAVAIFIFLVCSHWDDLILLTRTFFLGIVGYLACFIRLFYPWAIFAAHMKETQTFDIVLVMFAATALGLLGHELAILFWTSSDDRQKRFQIPRLPQRLPDAFPVATAFAFCAGMLYCVQLGPQGFFNAKPIGKEAAQIAYFGPPLSKLNEPSQRITIQKSKYKPWVPVRRLAAINIKVPEVPTPVKISPPAPAVLRLTQSQNVASPKATASSSITTPVPHTSLPSPIVVPIPKEVFGTILRRASSAISKSVTGKIHSVLSAFINAFNSIVNKLLQIDNWNATLNICFLFMLTSTLLRPSLTRWMVVIFSCVYLYGYCEFAHGARMDVVNGLFGIYVVYRLMRGRAISVSFASLLFFGFLFIVMQLWGAFRGMPMNDISWASLGVVFQRTTHAKNTLGIPFYEGTINDLMATMSGTIFLIKHHYMKFIWGHSYLDFLARTPPKILYPNRPDDLAWIFPVYGFTSGGGFFELAEAYYNFGLLGTLVVPLIITAIILLAVRRVRAGAGWYWHFTLYSFLGVWLRALLYQTFSFWKGYVTGMVIFGMLWLGDRLLRAFTALFSRQRNVKISVERDALHTVPIEV